ncbi:MAG: hypothetical protein ACI9SB_001887 [Candidatus Azotimanducaceae bacterium]|jgi:hypothetical protein
MLVAATVLAIGAYIAPPLMPTSIAAERPASATGDVEIVIGENRTIYEYRTAGRLMMIKIVPKEGRPYYMVPADGSPHFTDLDHGRKLYPQWVLFEW